MVPKKGGEVYQRSQGAQGEKATDPKQPRLALAVAVPGPFRGALTYGLDGQPSPPPPGSRVRVPLGARSVLGIALETLPEPTERVLKPISECLDAAPLLDSTQLALGRWLAQYYHAPLGEALRLFLPPEARRQEQSTQARAEALRLTAEGHGLLTALAADQVPPGLGRAPAQQAALRALGAGPQRRAELLAAGHTAPTLRTLVQKGWLEPCDASTPATLAPAPPLHSEQADAVAALTADLGVFRTTLLQGITGSGKTEVYLQVMARVLEAGQQVLVLVPEIGLTPQTEQRLAARLSAPVHTLHSGMASGLRNQRWQAGRSGAPMVLLGTRSSLFAPLPALGLIIVDEEHDESYKQQDGVRYSARDVAVKRGALQGCPVVLGSATPSLETLENARQGRYAHLRLRHRAGQAQAPTQRFVDLRKHAAPEGFAQPTLDALNETLTRGAQALVFLNRRGYAPALRCHACGWLADCDRCDARMTVHRDPARLRCHHCERSQPIPGTCPRCKERSPMPVGQGTQRAESLLQHRFPETPILRLDRDKVRSMARLEAELEAIAHTPGALLLGTQMLAKGHHFPRVELVVIVDGDSGLFSADFRAPERLAQLLVQVAGRAGREQAPGTVLIQTHDPEHPLLQAVVTQGYDAFAEAALQERALLGLPPFGPLALLRAEAPQWAPVERFLTEAKAALLDAPGAEAQSTLGPIRAPMARRSGRFRGQLLLQGTERAPLHRNLAHALPQIDKLPSARQVRWHCDIDPSDTY